MAHRFHKGMLVVAGVFLLMLVGGFFVLTLPQTGLELFGSLSPVIEKIANDPNADIKPQQPLAKPPHPIKAIYLTSWSAGSDDTVGRAIDLIDATELNAVMVDIKDYTGKVSYASHASSVIAYQAFEKRIPKINAMIKRFHDKGIYVIGRIAVFQDPHFASLRPEFALKSIKTGAPWADHKGITWLDAAAPAVWDYNIEIAYDALSRGFDEVNFDYIRFPTDGDLGDIAFAFYNPAVEPKHAVLQRFFKHLRDELPAAKISVDIFGETAVTTQLLGIGQRLEDPFAYVDAVSPMIYPSHYANGFLGFPNPAERPYEVIRYSMDKAFARIKKHRQELLITTSSTLPAFAELRPWLQDFDLGATYDAEKVRAQIRAVEDSARAAFGCAEPVAPATTTPACPEAEIGWMLWSAENSYTRGALRKQ